MKIREESAFRIAGAVGVGAILTIGLAGAAQAQSVPQTQKDPHPDTARIASAQPNQQLAGTAAYIGGLCTNLSGPYAAPDLAARCFDLLVTSGVKSPGTTTTNLEQITPQEVLAQTASIDGAIKPATSAVAARIATLGRLSFARQYAQLNKPILIASAGDTAGLLNGPAASKLQAFVNVVAGSGDRDTDALETGYDFDQKSVTGGIDYRFSPRLTAGVSLGYSDTDVDLAASSGDLSSKSIVGTVYGLYAVTDKFLVTGLVSYGSIDNKSRRNIRYTEASGNQINRVASGQADGSTWEATLTASYTLSGNDGWSYGPSASISGRWLKVDAFAETGAGGLNFAYDKQDATSLQFGVGFDVSKAISTSAGVISPYARIQGIYEAKDNSRSLAIKFVDDVTPSSFNLGTRLRTSAPDRSRAMIGGGLSALFANGWSAFADAEGVVGLKNFSGYNITLGLRKEF